MIRRHVLAALATGITAGSDDAARDALARIDWLIRGAARRRLERALIDAALATNEVVASDADTARHVLRVAALDVAGVPTKATPTKATPHVDDDASDVDPTTNTAVDPTERVVVTTPPIHVDPTDRAAVLRAYEARPTPIASRVPIFTILGGAVSLVALVSLSLATISIARGDRPSTPEASGAYVTGGVPASEPTIEAFLRDELADLVVAIDERRAGGTMAPTEARSPTALLLHPQLAAAWTDMVDALFGWLGSPRGGRVFRDASRTLRTKVRAVSDQLAAEGLAYYLRGDVLVERGNEHAVITAFKVDHIAFVTANGQPHRVLGLRRLDKLDLRPAALGLQSDDLGDPVVLLDQIDTHVTTRLLPTLADGAAYPMGDEWFRSRPGRQLAAAAGAAVRREMREALGKDALDAVRIGSVLDERGQRIQRWRDELDRKKLWMAATDDLFVKPKLFEALSSVLPPEELDTVRQLDAQLTALDATRIAGRVQQLLVHTVQRHEAQHDVDSNRSTALRAPPELTNRLIKAHVNEGFAYRATAELSAYLSQLINDPTTPQLSLWNLGRHAFHAKPTPEAFAAVVVIEGLARHIGVAPRSPVVHDDHIDLAVFAELGVPLASMSSADLHTAAVALWNELYGEAPTTLLDP